MNRALLVLWTCAAFACPASAQIRVFGDQAAWEAAVAAVGGTPVIETFDGFDTPDLTPASSPFNVNNDFSLEVTGGQGNVDDAFIRGGRFHGEIFPDIPNRHQSYIHRFAKPVFAFGQNLDGAASGRGIRLSTSQGTADVLDFIPKGSFQDGFLGFVSSTPVHEVTIVGSDSKGNLDVGEIYDALDARFAFGNLGFLGSTLDFRVQAVQQSGNLGIVAGSSRPLNIAPGPGVEVPSTAALSYVDAINRPISNTLVPDASINVSADTIEILFDPTNQTISELQSFRGFRFADRDDSLPPITGVTIDPATTLDLQPDDLQFFENNLTVNVAGLRLTSSSPNRILLNVTFDQGSSFVTITGDYNGNGSVEQGDLDIVLNNWGRNLLPGSGVAMDALPNGATFDDAFDQNELDAVLNNWGSGPPPSFTRSPVPEPTALGLVALLGLTRRDRRHTPAASVSRL